MTGKDGGPLDFVDDFPDGYQLDAPFALFCLRVIEEQSTAAYHRGAASGFNQGVAVSFLVYMAAWLVIAALSWMGF